MITESELAARIGPILSDGTPLADLINFDKREIAVRVLDDPEIHRIEMEKVFGRSWLLVGHESEVPNAGDYVQRYMGEDSVIVTRDLDGEVNVLLNFCEHRGMQVCWADRGSTRRFKCPYHGWVFDNKGSLVGVPMENDMYGDWDKSGYGLSRARVTVRQGLVFANFDEQAPPLDDFLGDFGWYVDEIFGGLEVEPLGAPIRWIMDSNWKIYMDQSGGDLYHFPTAHRALADLGLLPNPESMLWIAKVNTPEAHVVFVRDPAVLEGLVVTGDADDGDQRSMMVEQDLYSFADLYYTVSFFPAAGGCDVHPITQGDGTVIKAMELRGIDPQGPGKMNYWQTLFVEKGASEATKEGLRQQMSIGLGVAQDDFQAWISQQVVARGFRGKQRTLKYNALEAPNRPKGWPGPGSVYTGPVRDATQWDVWTRWYDMMTADEA